MSAACWTRSGKSFDEIWRARAEANPAKRYGRPAELGAYCAFLCSEHAGFITGQNLLVDGGSYPGHILMTIHDRKDRPRCDSASPSGARDRAARGCCAAPATAQTYPSRTVTVVVPFPAGGSVDGVARILVQKLNETVGQYFIVENRAGGASGTVGANAVAKAAPDGYTLLLSASVHVINPFLYKSVPYDVVKDFTPVTLLADGPLIVSTTPSVPANNLKDLFELVRKEPQKYTFATTSIGSASHLAIELLKRDAGLDTLVVAL